MRYRRRSTAQLNAISRSYKEKENKEAFKNFSELLNTETEEETEKAIQKFKKDFGYTSNSYKVLLNCYKIRQEKGAL